MLSLERLKRPKRLKRLERPKRLKRLKRPKKLKRPKRLKTPRLKRVKRHERLKRLKRLVWGEGGAIVHILTEKYVKWTGGGGLVVRGYGVLGVRG